MPADRRVLRRLLELVAIYRENGEAVRVPLNQEDIAGLAGTSRATANKVLRDAEQRGEIRLERGPHGGPRRGLDTPARRIQRLSRRLRTRRCRPRNARPGRRGDANSAH